MKTSHSLSVAFVLSLLGAACSTASSPSDPPVEPGDDAEVVASDKARITRPDATDAERAKLAAGNTEFALDLYGKLRSTAEGNIFYSPHSISSALAMTYAGARGDTERQMASALKFALPQARLHPAFNALDLELKSRGDGAAGATGGVFRLNVVNAIWGQKGYNFAAPFLDVLAENYGAGLRTLDFVESPDPSRVTINDWVEEQTEGKIEDLLPDGSITSDTRLVLTNAVYFNAAWATPFEVANTAPRRFTRADGSTTTVPTMSAQGLTTQYGEGAGYAAVELPYDGGQLSMLLVLPSDLGAFEAGLDKARFDGIVSSLSVHSVEVALPKFELKSDYDLTGPLSDLGMKDAFTEGKADLSGINGGRDLFIGGVVHKGFIALNEAGTEAAAATGVFVGTTSVPTPAAISLDHPFLFFIRDLKTSTVVFAGRITDPTP